MKIKYIDYNKLPNYLYCHYIHFGSEQGIGNTLLAYDICNNFIKEIPISTIIEIENE